MMCVRGDSQSQHLFQKSSEAASFSRLLSFGLIAHISLTEYIKSSSVNKTNHLLMFTQVQYIFLLPNYCTFVSNNYKYIYIYFRNAESCISGSVLCVSSQTNTFFLIKICHEDDKWEVKNTCTRKDWHDSSLVLGVNGNTVVDVFK